ncbi:hypothetical protein PYV02_15265 [Leifsonia sp. H3M29-4]|uniref:hypothetical protein n=1 Tax=Salinibacterium metalliresistens TaxID=3031321 RepID=UPI0023D9A2FF|nr:hypothetical protein [Salinibacterium metalliresistens]MDF1480439.1 hypothetical protein [Salinibacterium metalliresistens]
MSDLDPEITAMTGVASALTPLDEDARGRVLRWAAERFEVTLQPTRLAVVEEEADAAPMAVAVTSEYASFAELFENATPRTTTDKALIAAYWFQVIQGSSGFQSQQLNTELKNLGHGLTNVTDSLGSAERAKPTLVMQVNKSGKSKQARKTYKLTLAGISYVKGMIG